MACGSLETTVDFELHSKSYERNSNVNEYTIQVMPPQGAQDSVFIRLTAPTEEIMWQMFALLDGHFGAGSTAAVVFTLPWL